MPRRVVRWTLILSAAAAALLLLVVGASRGKETPDPYAVVDPPSL